MYSQGRLYASHATFEPSISPRDLSAPVYFQQPPKTQIRAPTIPPLTPRGMEYGINAHPISTHSLCSGPLPLGTQLLAPITHLLTPSAGASLGSRHQRCISAKLACSPEGHRSWARPAYTRMSPHDTDSLFLSSIMRQHAPF